MQTFLTKVRATNLSQPDAVTCQATCVAMALGQPSPAIPHIRQQLLSLGDPGSPSVMGQVLRAGLPGRYSFDVDASLKDCQNWLQAGELLITHGWFTGSGHVICLDGLELDPSNLSYRFSVKDPWSEFFFSAWRYSNPSIKFYDGFYSSRGIYAACVAGQSVSHAREIFRRGELDSSRGGMWVHRIR